MNMMMIVVMTLVMVVLLFWLLILMMMMMMMCLIVALTAATATEDDIDDIDDEYKTAHLFLYSLVHLHCLFDFSLAIFSSAALTTESSLKSSKTDDSKSGLVFVLFHNSRVKFVQVSSTLFPSQ